eukprot:123675-Chlamydomonas_euryale.AAC.1
MLLGGKVAMPCGQVCFRFVGRFEAAAWSLFSGSLCVVVVRSLYILRPAGGLSACFGMKCCMHNER